MTILCDLIWFSEALVTIIYIYINVYKIRVRTFFILESRIKQQQSGKKHNRIVDMKTYRKLLYAHNVVVRSGGNKGKEYMI